MTETPSLLRNWYFCINAKGFDTFLPHIRAAVMSARANTTLAPHCLYSGDEARHRAILTRLGVTVIDHKPSLAAYLRQGYGEHYDAFAGHWLRVDLPFIETSEEFVLYSDVDVMFLGHPALPQMPRVLAAAPEYDRNSRRHFNSGVMVMNIPRLRDLYGPFCRAIRARLSGNFSYPPHDQESYNRFFRASALNRLRGRARSRLAPELNWKPYWGIAPNAKLVHFHGPKPPKVRVFQNGGGSPADKGLYDLWDSDRAAYDHYATQWEGYEAAGRPLTAVTG